MSCANYNAYHIYLNYGFMLVLNIILSSKLYKLMVQLQIKGKVVWLLSTIFLGLFPVILFNELIITKTDHNKVS